jgi:hypothetical protein
MRRVFSLNQQEIELIDHMVDFIWENDLIIKKGLSRFFDCFNSKKSQILKMFCGQIGECFINSLKILRHLPVVTITQQVIKYAHVYKEQLILVGKILVKMGIGYKISLLIIAFLL